MSLKEIFKIRQIPLSAKIDNPKIQAFFLTGTSFVPETEEEFLYLGCHYRSSGQYDLMKEHYQQAGPRGYHYLALHYSETKNHAAMMAAYQTAVDLGSVASMTNLGLHHKQAKNKRTARQLFLRGHRLGDIAATACLGRMAFEDKQYIQMEEYYQQCLASPQLTPKIKAGVYGCYGDYYLELKQYEKAVGSYQTAITAKNPACWEIELGLAHCYAQLDQRKKAGPYFHRAAYKIIRDRSIRALLKIAKVAEQVGLTELALSFYIGSISGGSMAGRLALLRLLIGRHVEPDEFLEWTQLGPTYPPEDQCAIDQVTGDYYRQRQEYDQMEIYYRRGGHQTALMRHYVTTDRLDQAESYLNELLVQDNPDLYPILRLLSCTRQSSWVDRCLDKLLASTDVKQLKELTPLFHYRHENQLPALLARRLELGDTEVYLDLADLYDESEKEKKISTYHQALTAGHSKAHLRLGLFYYLHRELEPAEFHYRAALEAKLTEAYAWLGLICQKLGRIPEALTYYQQAIISGHQMGYRCLINYYAKAHQHHQAEALALEYWSECPGSGVIHLKNYYRKYPSRSGLHYARRMNNGFLFCQIFYQLLPQMTKEIAHLSLGQPLLLQPPPEMKSRFRLVGQPEAQLLREIYVRDLTYDLTTTPTYFTLLVKDVREIVWAYLMRTPRSKRIGLSTTIQALLGQTKEEPLMYPSYLRSYFRQASSWFSVIPGDLHGLLEKYLLFDPVKHAHAPSRQQRQVRHRFDSVAELNTDLDDYF